MSISHKPAVGARLLHELGVAGGQRRRADDVVLRERGERRLVRQPQRLLEALPRVAGQAVRHPRHVVGIGHAVEQGRLGRRQQHQLHAVDDRAQGTGRLDDRAGDVDERLPVLGVRGVEVHHAADAVGGAVRGAGDHHAPVAVPDQDHVVEILVVEHRHDVADVQIEVDVGTQQVGPLPEPAQRRRVHLVAGRSQEPRHPLVAPATVSTTVHEYVGRHRLLQGSGEAVRGTWARSPARPRRARAPGARQPRREPPGSRRCRRRDHRARPRTARAPGRPSGPVRGRRRRA